MTVVIMQVLIMQVHSRDEKDKTRNMFRKSFSLTKYKKDFTYTKSCLYFVREKQHFRIN